MDVLAFPPQGDDRDFEHFRTRVAEFRRCGQEVQIAGLLVFARPTAPSEAGGDWAQSDGVVEMFIPSRSKDISISSMPA